MQLTIVRSGCQAVPGLSEYVAFLSDAFAKSTNNNIFEISHFLSIAVKALIIIVVAAMSLSPTSPTPTAFSRSMAAFKRQLSLRDIEAFEFTTFEELKDSIDRIQHEQANRRGYRNLNKIRPFLQFLQQYARVIEQFVSAKPDFLAFIWVSRTHLHTQIRLCSCI